MSQTPPLVLTPTMGGACRFGSTYSCSLDSRRGGLWWTESDTENSSLWTPHKSKTERNEGKYGDCIFSMSEIRLFRLNDSNSKNVDITLVDKAVKVNWYENGFICIALSWSYCAYCMSRCHTFWTQEVFFSIIGIQNCCLTICFFESNKFIML